MPLPYFFPALVWFGPAAGISLRRLLMGGPEETYPTLFGLIIAWKKASKFLALTRVNNVLEVIY